MRLLLHALTTAERLSETPSGLRGGALVRVEAGGLAGWATRLADPSPPFSRAELIAHHEIIARLHEQVAACLPARFPTWLADEQELRADMRRRAAELAAALEVVRGQCEVAVTVLWTTISEPIAPAEGPTTGTGYLRARQQAFAGSDQRRERARELADEIERLAGADVQAVKRQVCPSPTVAVSSALLAPRARAAELIDRLNRPQDGVRILVNGPWPPYSFAGAETREA